MFLQILGGTLLAVAIGYMVAAYFVSDEDWL